MTRKIFETVAAPMFPGMGSKTYAAFPVWSNSVSGEVRFNPLPKKQAVRIFHEARRWERMTRGGGGKGCITHEGKIGRSGLLVLHAMLFDFLNYKSGRLDPSWAAIAERACCSVRTVARALARLKRCGILAWVRRRIDSYEGKIWRIEQDTNAYGVAAPGQWPGYIPAPAAPAPHPQTWGAHDRPPHPFDQARIDSALGITTTNPLGPLAGSLARLAARRPKS